MQNKIFILPLFILALAGCTTSAPPAVVREAGTFTAITFPIISDQWDAGKVRLAVKDKKGCGVLGADVLPETATADFTGDIDGNQDIFFDITRTDGKRTCNRVGTFYATKGNEYSLNVVTSNNQCEVSLSEKTPKGVERKIKTYPSYVSPVNNTKVCENKDKLYY